MTKAARSCIASHRKTYEGWARDTSNSKLLDHIKTHTYFTHPQNHQGWAERLYRRTYLLEAHKRGLGS